jgi:uncharacterized protein (TIGR02266 family)
VDVSPPFPAASKTVVIADDTAFVRDRFKVAIERAGHRALTAGVAQDLIQQVRTRGHQIDLLLLDLRLPGASGADIVHAIRKVDGGRLPILVFSGTIATAAEVRVLASLGVAGYINEYASVQHILPALSPHLFPERNNRRASPRMVLGVPVAYRFGNTIAAALTLNLGRGGIAIRTTSLLDPGTRLKVRFRLPGARRDIDAEARVAWTDRRVGMGLQFEGVSREDHAMIDDFVDQHFFTNRKA